MNRIWHRPFLYTSPSGKWRLAQWWHFQVTVWEGHHRAYVRGRPIGGWSEWTKYL